MSDRFDEKAKEITETAHIHFVAGEDNELCKICGKHFRLHLYVGETLESRIATALRSASEKAEKLAEVLQWIVDGECCRTSENCMEQIERKAKQALQEHRGGK